jgi:hypothetical protein
MRVITRKRITEYSTIHPDAENALSEWYEKTRQSIWSINVMTKIKTERQYEATCERIEELLKIVGNDTPTDDRNFIELDLISDLVVDYEEQHFPVGKPALINAGNFHKYDIKFAI